MRIESVRVPSSSRGRYKSLGSASHHNRPLIFSSQDRLEYNRKTNELVSPSIGVAFPIIDGIPNLSPYAGRIIASESEPEDEVHEEDAAFREKT